MGCGWALLSSSFFGTVNVELFATATGDFLCLGGLALTSLRFGLFGVFSTTLVLGNSASLGAVFSFCGGPSVISNGGASSTGAPIENNLGAKIHIKDKWSSTDTRKVMTMLRLTRNVNTRSERAGNIKTSLVGLSNSCFMLMDSILLQALPCFYLSLNIRSKHPSIYIIIY